MMASLCIEFIDYPKFQEYILEILNPVYIRNEIRHVPCTS